MSWMLQPHNYGQALNRNLYNVGYRRTATYKGMEGLGQMGPLYTCPDGTQVYRSSDCPGGQPAPNVQQQIADLWGYVFANAPAQQTVYPGQTNYTPWLILGGGLLLVMLISRR
jgi:hypothetical protein